MDGKTQQRGGCPSVTFYDGSLPVLGMIVSKTSQSSTLITGSTAAGEALPPHFQFSTTAKSERCKRISLETVRFMKNVRGKYSHDEVKIFPALLD